MKRGAAAAGKKRTLRKVSSQQHPEAAEDVLNLEEKPTVVDEKPVIMEEEKSVFVEDRLVIDEKKDREGEIEENLVANTSDSSKSKCFCFRLLLCGLRLCVFGRNLLRFVSFPESNWV